MKLISDIFHNHCGGDGKVSPSTLRQGRLHVVRTLIQTQLRGVVKYELKSPSHKSQRAHLHALGTNGPCLYQRLHLAQIGNARGNARQISPGIPKCLLECTDVRELLVTLGDHNLGIWDTSDVDTILARWSDKSAIDFDEFVSHRVAMIWKSVGTASLSKGHALLVRLGISRLCLTLASGSF